ncbi:anti-sigma factor RsbA family regulatory protein [Catelliglobosispora koreensis]|uniref:anti-sigma factor RsbA family regulatory protein n=1 Tax=Catelliglobosispora koreensis TaxID=129052 RepID=UPI00058C0A33
MAANTLFEHLGAPYRNVHDYLSVTVDFAEHALARGNPVLVAVPGHKVDVIRTGLGAQAGQVSFADMAVAGRNPGRILPAVLIRFAEQHPGQRVSVIGEPTWAGRSAAEFPACVTHEALINEAFAGRDAEILCPYDISALDPAAIADAYSTHPLLRDSTRTWVNTGYEDPQATLARLNFALPAPFHAQRLSYALPEDLVMVRKFAASHAEAAGLSQDRIEALTIAVSELAANTTLHTKAPGEIAVWVEDGAFICQVTDSGYLSDPLAGRVPPSSMEVGGHGLVLVNQLTDLVRVHTSLLGTTIRLHQNLDVVA